MIIDPISARPYVEEHPPATAHKKPVTSLYPSLDAIPPAARENVLPASYALVVETVELAQRIHNEHRYATEEERALLSRWMGWGPYAKAFEPDPKGHWEEVAASLRLLLGPEGFEQASAAITNSYFTDDILVKTIWQLAQGLGFAGGRVLEAGCGSGQIMQHAPHGLPLKITGIEREPMSALIAQLRFPEATILTASYEKTSIVEDRFDLSIGNVPFGDIKIYDPELEFKFSIHNYFLFRNLQAAKHGSYVISITTGYTLDAREEEERRQLQRFGNLIGAIRLPSGAHSASKTEVLTDILILQKRSNDPFAYRGQDWTKSTEDLIPGLHINEYFAKNPHHILGATTKVRHGLYPKDELKVGMPANFSQALENAIEDIVRFAHQKRVTYPPVVDLTRLDENIIKLRGDGLKEGSFHLMEGELVQIVEGEAVPVKLYKDEITALVRLRSAAVDLLEGERDFTQSDEDLAPLRMKLNAAYYEYLRRFGAVHRGHYVERTDEETGEKHLQRKRPRALAAFSRDPEYTIVLGLEDYDEDTKIPKKAPIFFRRVNVPPIRKDHAESPEEALALCMDQHGELNVETIARLLGVAEEAVLPTLGEMVYEDPALRGALVTRDEYLSDNVRIKLREARHAASFLPQRYQRNVTALEAVVPEDIYYAEIKVLLGANWVPTTDIERFAEELFGLAPQISYNGIDGQWNVKTPDGALLLAGATSTWGTGRASGYALLETSLNKRIAVVYDYPDSNGKKPVKNLSETLAAREKQRAIEQRFKAWIWESEERQVKLARIYNDRFNATVPRTYDGSHLSFPGMTEEWRDKLYPWQKDFVWRMVCSRAALCGHPVGAGKTTQEVAGAMTLKRMGLIQKAAIVVPDHLLEQITAEAQRLYPGANILMVSRDDLKKEHRRAFAAKAAMGTYDFVVITHRGLGAIGVHRDTEKAYMDQRIAEYKDAMYSIMGRKDDASKRTIKQLEKAIDRMRQRQNELMNQRRDPGVTFEQLGISYLIIDEFHLYKNLGLPSNQSALTVRAAKRSIDMEMKLRWLEEHNETRPFAAGFTATPVSNSMVEAYVMAWYLRKDLLREYGLYNVDAFASLFIDFEDKVEVSANGASFQNKVRPRTFVNLPEFMAMFTRFADIRSEKMLDGKRPKHRTHTIIVPQCPETQAFVDDLVERTNDIQSGSPQTINGVEDNMLLITTHGRMGAIYLPLVGRWPRRHTKIESVAQHMCSIYHLWQKEADYLDGECKSLQIGFCDIGTPSKERGEQAYGQLKQFLIEGGIPAHTIRYIHEGKNDTEKSKLFEDCRIGKVSILIGSTEKMGTGTNIQNRAVALHHLDFPWKPAEVKQRNGRIIRPGNLFPEVDIYHYVQERTFDAFSAQTLHNKSIFIDQLMSGAFSSREIDAVSEDALTYGQIKAAATGDPLLLEQADISAQVTQLERLYSIHTRDKNRLLGQATTSREIAADSLCYAELYEDLAGTTSMTEEPGFTTTRNEYIDEKAEVGEYLADKIVKLLNRGGGTELLGRWFGNEVRSKIVVQGLMYAANIVLGPQNKRTSIQVKIGQGWCTKGQTWRLADALEHLVASAGEYAEQEKKTARHHLDQANAFEAQAQSPFDRQAEYDRLTDRKAKIDEYCSFAAEWRGQDDKEDELKALRERLMQETPTTDITKALSNEEEGEGEGEGEGEKPLARPRKPVAPAPTPAPMPMPITSPEPLPVLAPVAPAPRMIRAAPTPLMLITNNKAESETSYARERETSTKIILERQSGNQGAVATNTALCFGDIAQIQRSRSKAKRKAYIAPVQATLLNDPMETAGLFRVKADTTAKPKEEQQGDPMQMSLFD